MQTTDNYRKQLSSLYSKLRNADKYDRQDIEAQMSYIRAKIAQAERIGQ
jgi:hypothetical protein